MAQHDYVIANQGFPAFRSDLNDALAAIVSNNSGATEPATMFAHQMWVDTAADPSILKIRNADNDAWITIGTISQTSDAFKLTPADGVSTNTIAELTSGSGVTIDGVLLKDGLVNTLTVGRGAGDVSTNTAVGASALSGSNTGANNTAIGYQVLDANTSGEYNVAIGNSTLGANSSGVRNTACGFTALANNTTASYNTAFGMQALLANTTGANNTAVGNEALVQNTTASGNTAVGYQAGYSGTTAARNTLIGYQVGYALTTGSDNTFVGINNGVTGAAGSAITTGSKNTIIGAYNGNQGGLDIRTASNRIVLSDGDGNPRLYSPGTPGCTIPYGNGYTIISSTGTYFGFRFFASNNGFNTSANGGASTADAVLFIGKDAVTSRSINAGGTVNASGADYAEYMTKAGDFTIAKGDVVGVNSDGKLTNVFADAISFVVKSTDPSYVGGDIWAKGEDVGLTPEKPQENATQEEFDAWQVAYAEFESRREAAREKVDRIAFAGQVPVNVTGATAGQYIIPVNDNGAIKGEAVSNPTFEQYQIAVGKVIAIEEDGRAKIIVKVA